MRDIDLPRDCPFDPQYLHVPEEPNSIPEIDLWAGSAVRSSIAFLALFGTALIAAFSAIGLMIWSFG